MQINSNAIQILNNTIRRALKGEHNEQRAHAQTEVLALRDQNPSEFFYLCSIVVQDESFDKITRQYAGTVANRLLSMKNLHTSKYYWDEVSNERKQDIKNNSLSTLICEHIEVVKSAALIIAAIAAIQLPRNCWENIVDIMAQNCGHAEINIRIASITTLGYMCQFLKKANAKISHRLSQQILGSIIFSARENNDFMIKTSLKALEDSMSFLEDLMADSKYRDAVFEQLTSNFKNQVEPELTYQAMFEFVKVASPFLMDYRTTLIDLTEVHLQKKNPIAIMNCQMWEVIGSQYADNLALIRERVSNIPLGDNFLQTVVDSIMPHLMKCLLIIDPKEDLEEHEELRNSALKAIDSFVRVCNKNIVDMITNSVGTIILSTNEYHQQATVMLFSTIAEYPDREYVKVIFHDAFDHLFALLDSRSELVVKKSLAGFVRLAESIPQVFLTHQNVSQIMDKIFGFVAVDLLDVRMMGVQILSGVTEGLKENPDPVSNDPNILLTKVVKFYTENLIMINQKQPEINEKLTAIILNMVMNTNNRQIIVQLIDFMITEYQKINCYDKPVNNFKYLVEQIMSVLNTSILAHKNAVPNNSLLAKLCDLVDYHIKKFGTEAEGLSLIGSLATTFNKSFEQRSYKYWSIINEGMKAVNDVSTFKATLNCIGDYARMMQSGFFNNATSIMQTLLAYVQLNLDRDVKLCIITCIGDLVISIKDYASTFIKDLIHIADLCFSAVTELFTQQKDTEYLDEFKSNLIQMYSCMVFSANANHVSKQMMEHFNYLATFIVRTCSKDVHPTVEYLKQCLYLLHDSAAFYWNIPDPNHTVRNIIYSKQVKEMIYLISQFSSRPDIKELIDFIETGIANKQNSNSRQYDWKQSENSFVNK